MKIGRLAVIALAAVLALGGLGTAFALSGDNSRAGPDPADVRKDDSGGDDVTTDDEDDVPQGDGDDTQGRHARR
jgi:hypothetical protein